MKLIELLQGEHPYPACGFHTAEYKTFENFLDEINKHEINLNLCYRFDITKNYSKNFEIHIFTALQRKGIIVQHIIHTITEDDMNSICKYLTPHFEILKKIWEPFFNQNNHEL